MKSATAFVPSLVLMLASGLASNVLAQTPPPAGAPGGPGGPNQMSRISGTLTAIADDSVTVRDDQGKETKLSLSLDVSVVAARPVDKASIKPGDFVASANISEGEGVGRSIEMRLFPAAQGAGASGPMTQPGAAPGQMMTNATVTKVAQTAAGLEIDVQFPGGVRHLVVPADVTVMGSYPVDGSALKIGMSVMVFAMPRSDGTLRANRIQINATPAR